MKTVTIKHRYTGAVLFAAEVADDDAYPIRTALQAGIAARAYLARADLTGAYLAGAYLAGAYLADANLAGANLAGAYLARADLTGAYLAGADLTDANLADANLAGAYLARADLTGANLARARNVPIGVTATSPAEPYVRPTTPEARAQRAAQRAADYRARNPHVPVIERLDAKILEAISREGCALKMSDWHHGDPCGTTHCRAGWAIFLAGPAGAELERQTSPEQAGRAIYLASTGRVPHFFASDERALEDIKRCAADQCDSARAGEE